MRIPRLAVLFSLGVTLVTRGQAVAESSPRRVSCPVIVDRQTGKFSESRAKYHCYSERRNARRAGYQSFSFDDSPALCSATPTPSGTPSGGSGDYNLSGPGQKSSVVFSALSGGTVTYSFPGGGDFEIKIMNASSGQRISKLVEISSAGSATVPFSNPGVPMFIKAEGPGAWTVAIDLP